MPNPITRPVLLVGGSGIVGQRVARTLRRLHPSLPIVLGGRDHARAATVAQDIGGPTSAVRVDLGRADLALPATASFAAVAVFVKDAGMRALKYAQQHEVGYVAFSDFAFDIAPTIAQFVHAPGRAAVVELGHAVGGVATLAALHVARELATITSIAIAAVVSADDTGGPAAQQDFVDYARGGHGALVLRDGNWVWVKDAAALRSFVDASGRERVGAALPLLDVASLAAATSAHSIRVDLAVRGADEVKSTTELVIELQGTLASGARSTIRVALSDGDVHARLSAYGAALVIERLVGLRGAPVGPGLYHPEHLVEPAYAVRALAELGVRVEIGRSQETALQIGVIGSGNIGGTLTRRLRALGHEVLVANSRGPASLTELAHETGARAVTVHEAARATDLVILAVPQEAIARLPRDLFAGVPAETVVIDAGNYYPRHRDGRIEAIEQGTTESRWVADTLGRPVVKAYNNLWARDLLAAGRPSGAGDRFALPIASDDPAARDKVIALTHALGFDAVDAGGLDDSWRQQPGTPVYTANLDAAGTRRVLGEASRARAAELSGTAQSPGSWLEPR